MINHNDPARSKTVTESSAFREIEAAEVAEARRQAAVVKRADDCALWSRLETRYLRLPSPLRHNIFPQDASAL